MSDVRKYVLVNREDMEGDYEYGSLREAKRKAAAYGEAVIARTYVIEDGDLIYDDSELVWTPDGGNVWPPR